ncbi:MAG TPA: hypothetical protein VLB46_19455 [Pyrinomonadaceae bacterium]|nr:hypothetical protein [Pyrinomonadaceae bacterium]
MNAEGVRYFQPTNNAEGVRYFQPTNNAEGVRYFSPQITPKAFPISAHK